MHFVYFKSQTLRCLINVKSITTCHDAFCATKMTQSTNHFQVIREHVSLVHPSKNHIITFFSSENSAKITIPTKIVTHFTISIKIITIQLFLHIVQPCFLRVLNPALFTSIVNCYQSSSSQPCCISFMILFCPLDCDQNGCICVQVHDVHYPWSPHQHLMPYTQCMLRVYIAA